MKAICTKRVFANIGTKCVIIYEGETVNFCMEDNTFIIDGVRIKSPSFFDSFRVTEGECRMTYSDFEYILCNYVFTTAVLFPEEYSGMRHLIIQTWDRAILITVNREETTIRVSFENGQEIYSSYEEALDGIKNHKYDVKS